MGGLRAWCIFMICGRYSCFEAGDVYSDLKAHDEDVVVVGTRAKAGSALVI